MVDFAEEMAKLSDEKLQKIAHSDEQDYRAEAREAARTELESRGVEVEPAATTNRDVSSTQEDLPRDLVARLTESLQSENSIFREVASVASFGIAVSHLHQSIIELAAYVARFRDSWGIFGAGGDLIPGSWFVGLLIGLVALAPGIWLSPTWRRNIGILLIGLAAIFLQLELFMLGSPRFSIFRMLLSGAELLLGLWLLRIHRTHLSQEWVATVGETFE